MSDLANRLMLRRSRGRNTLPTAIFGAAGRMAQSIEMGKPPVRIGLWPVKSQSEPEVAMGLATILALLLDRYQDVRIYRIFARLEGDVAAYSWKVGDSQFDVDNWQIDDLDENVAVWGELTQQDGQWQLQLEIENDLLDTDEVKTLSYSAENIPVLTGQLITAAEDIAGYLNTQETRLLAPAFEPESWHIDQLRSLLKDAFAWEIRLLLHLWGKEWTADERLVNIERLQTAGQGAGSLGAWVIPSLIARAMSYEDEDANQVFLRNAERVIQAFPQSSAPAIILSSAVFDAEQTQLAYNMLENAVEQYEDEPELRLALAELYRRGGRAADALTAFQDAIEDEVTNLWLFLRYANLLIVLDFSGIAIDDFILTDPENTPSPMLREAIEAYEAALAINPQHTAALAAQIQQLLDIDERDKRLWPAFERLVTLDSGGEYVRNLADLFYNLNDLDPAIDILESAIERHPERADLYLCLATAYLADDDSEAAAETLNEAVALTDDVSIQADIQRLRLLVDDPEFEMRLGELTGLIDAGNQISADDVEYLEDILERAPSFSDIYTLVARAYLRWDEESTAIETLLDGHKQIPDDPEIAVLLGQTLWESGEQELAFTYLNKGLAENPMHVPLLAVMGQYLFEDGQEDAARAYLARAEMIAPRHPVLTQVRANIARTLGN